MSVWSTRAYLRTIGMYVLCVRALKSRLAQLHRDSLKFFLFFIKSIKNEIMTDQCVYEKNCFGLLAIKTEYFCWPGELRVKKRCVLSIFIYLLICFESLYFGKHNSR